MVIGAGPLGKLTGHWVQPPLKTPCCAPRSRPHHRAMHRKLHAMPSCKAVTEAQDLPGTIHDEKNATHKREYFNVPSVSPCHMKYSILLPHTRTILPAYLIMSKQNKNILSSYKFPPTKYAISICVISWQCVQYVQYSPQLRYNALVQYDQYDI